MRPFPSLSSPHHIAPVSITNLLLQLSLSASSGGWAGARLAALLGTILALDGLLMILCVAVALLGGGLNTFAFMSAEVSQNQYCMLSVGNTVSPMAT